jgi:thioredoxin-like negative regulator of GroEL
MKTHDEAVRPWIAGIAALALLALAGGVRAEDPRWTQARDLEAQERWVEAAQVYAAILADEPTSQEAAVKRANCRLEAGFAAQAADTLEAAVDMAP